MFHAAVAESAAAAVVLFQYPLARSIALLIGTLMSNPGDIKRIAEEWVLPAAEGAAGGFDELNDQIKRLVQEINKKKEGEGVGWGGEVFEKFEQASELFLSGLTKAKEYHLGIGQGLGQMAGLYHLAAVVCFWVAQAMTLLAALQVVSYLFVTSQLAIRGAINLALGTLGKALKGVLTNKVKALGTLSFLVAGVTASAWGLAEFFEGQKPKPDFKAADVKTVEEKDGVYNLEPRHKQDGYAALGGMP